MESLYGKLAAVTGGTRGIGPAIAARLLGEGAAVAICGRSNQSVETALDALRPLGRVYGAVCDVT